MKRILPVAAIIILLLTVKVNGQIFKQAGGGIHLGIAKVEGNSPDLTCISGSAYIEAMPWFADNYLIRLNFFYIRKAEYLIPENRTDKYYPFVKAFTLKGIARQILYGRVFIEEGFGILLLNDRIYSDRNMWNFGVAFSAQAGIDFRNKDMEGFMLGLIIEYGLSLNNSAASFLDTAVNFGYSVNL